MADTFFTTPPRWEWLLILSFFFGGLAGGSYVIALLADLFGDASDRPLARLGYYVALPAVVVCTLLLIAELTRPDRFWHMLVMSERGQPMFKYWSPMSVGAWGLALFGGAAFLSWLGALAESGWAPAVLTALRSGPLAGAVRALGGLAGFFLASFAGVLLAVTNRPIWSDSPLLGCLLLLSAASISDATLTLLGLWRGVGESSIAWLGRLDQWLIVLELAVLLAFVASLGSVARVWVSAWGALLLVGVVLAGLMAPLALHRRPRLLGRLSAPAAAALVLVGGFVLRLVLVLAAEAV
jgi:formate-dependent nitrite reductase membrane component NrfD